MLAYTTRTGLLVGKWILRLRQSTPEGLQGPEGQGRLFVQEDGCPWDSDHHRHTFLCPVLHLMRQEGDPYLQPFDRQPGNSIPDKFMSVHCHRRGGARTHVSCLKGAKGKRGQLMMRFVSTPGGTGAGPVMRLTSHAGNGLCLSAYRSPYSACEAQN